MLELNRLNLEYIIIIFLLLIWAGFLGHKTFDILEERAFLKEQKKPGLLGLILEWVFMFFIIFMSFFGYKAPIKKIDVGTKALEQEIREYKNAKNYKTSLKINEIYNEKAKIKEENNLKEQEQIQKNQINNFNQFLKEN